MSIKQLRVGQNAPSSAPAPEESHRPEESYRMFVRDLVLLCSIGAYPEERLKPQRVRFNVDMRVQAPTEPIADDLAKVFSYATVVAGIRQITEQGHINLVETLAQQIASFCLTDPRVAEVRVRVEKLDVEPAAAGVGVEIERTRHTHPAVADLFAWTASSEAARRRSGGG
jgi:7,8-dihydroneopterin aldolase/epimerase/oxygenase